MIRRSLFLLLILGAPSLRAQSILPEHFGHWSATKPPESVPARPDSAAKDVLAESGLDGAESRIYSNPDLKTAPPIFVTSYKLHDSSGAYEAYTFLRQPTGVVDEDVFGKRVVLGGNIVLVVNSANYLTMDDQALLTHQLQSKADKTPLPPIPNYLPDRDRVAGSEEYALGPAAFRAALSQLGRPDYVVITDSVGFNSGAEAILARYHTSRDGAVLLLLEYPTPQLAGLHWKHLEQALPAEAKKSGTSIERKGSLLAIVLSPSSPNYAARVREAVNYETQVTWNEPTHTITDPPITTVLAKIIIATGIFMLVAIVFGVAFGGVRVLMKSLFPGKVFDRPEQMDVLQLGLSSKRINSRDFY
jgi:hypothetical protein